MKKFVMAGALLAAFGMAGCTQEQVQLVRTQLEVVIPPEQLYQCPVLRSLPKTSTLRDSDVARLIVQLHRNNLTCKASLDAIKAFVNSAQARAMVGNQPGVLERARRAANCIPRYDSSGAQVGPC